MQRDGKRSISEIALTDANSVSVDNGAKSIAYFCRRKPVKATRKLIEELKEISRGCGNKNVRLCLHENPQAQAHDMIILEKKGKYYPPHKHLEKGESFHIIEGKMGVFIFAESGSVIDASILSPDDNFIYRVGVNMYHAVMPLSDLVVYHEAKPGPFLGEKDSIYPSWAPPGDKPQEADNYKNKLLGILGIREKG